MQSMPRLNTNMDSPTTPELQQSAKWSQDEANTSAPELMNSPSSMYSVNSPTSPVSPNTPSRSPFVNEKRCNVDTPLLRSSTQIKHPLSLPTPVVSRQSSTRMSQTTVGSLTVGRQIGSGTFSKIYEAYAPQGIFALKTRLSSTPEEVFRSEMAIMDKLERNGAGMPIVQYYPELSDKDHCVLEMFQTTLESLVRSPKFRPDENSIDFFDYRLMIQPVCGLKTWCLWAQQLVKGLKYIHSHNIVHADLKPDNVLAKTAYLGSETELAISDFSGAIDLDAQPGSVLPSELPNHFALSPVFSDPELRHGTMLPSFGSDIYALGLVLAFCATAQEPYSTAKNATQRILWMDKVGPLDSFDMDVSQRLKLVRPVIELLLKRSWDGVDEALEALLASA